MNKAFLTFLLLLLNYTSFCQVLDTANLVVPKQKQARKMSQIPAANVLCREGNISYRMGLVKEGISYFKQADLIDSTNSLIKQNIGFGYMRLSSYDDAIQQFKHAILLNERDSSAKRSIILCYMHKGDYEESILNAKKYLKEYPVDPEGYYNLMTVYYADRDLKQASKYGTMAMKLYEQVNSRSVYDAYYFLGKIYFEQENFKKSDSMFQKVRDRGIRVEDKYNRKL
ncbi:tetratricopeptide repeat protein [Pedobacter gandavensis]|uniref:tetratricopeptide repeat protein n=1 Tax=Pedobacter gandavensis TaxID=2679963 RepID=UPI00292E3A02|nr:hypothetical protein [Pedobacter gandavensis]